MAEATSISVHIKIHFFLKKSKGDGNSNEYINSYRKNSYSRKIALGITSVMKRETKWNAILLS